ncbi:MAG: PAS/PAC sensor hybrid histidine kinase [Parcubacteria group bacterium GW2011_GWC2_44_22]|nr:MAG: PAS/PAC sensor hybrid histidine kinase [Parcubacteria group bacterium GW2011_GWC2_44_22]
MKKILLCEDDPDIRASSKNILEKHGYETHTAPDGQEAIAMAIKVNPDLILLDIRMPKLDGLEVAGEIRKHNTQTKIIFITAFQSPELTKEAAKYDIFDYIVKPASAEDILTIVKKALSAG